MAAFRSSPDGKSFAVASALFMPTESLAVRRPTHLSRSRHSVRRRMGASRIKNLRYQKQIRKQRPQMDRRVQIIDQLRANRWLRQNQLHRRDRALRVALQHREERFVLLRRSKPAPAPSPLHNSAPGRASPPWPAPGARAVACPRRCPRRSLARARHRTA